MLKVVNIEDDLQLRDNKYTCEKFENANKDIYCLKEDTQCCENYLPRPDFLFSRILVTYLNISPILTLPTFPNSLQLLYPSSHIDFYCRSVLWISLPLSFSFSLFMLASIINIVLLSTVLVVIFNHLYLCFNLIFIFIFLNYVLCCVLIIPVILLIVMQHFAQCLLCLNLPTLLWKIIGVFADFLCFANLSYI